MIAEYYSEIDLNALKLSRAEDADNHRFPVLLLVLVVGHWNPVAV